MWIHIVADALNRALLVHQDKKHLYFVNETDVDTNVFTTSIVDTDLPRVNAEPFNWVLVGDSLQYRPLSGQELEDVKAHSKLLETKRWIYFEIINRISLARARCQDVTHGQAETYRLKYEQAVYLQQHNYDNSALANAPMVVDYAELDNCSARVAAEQIILKHQFYIDTLTKTEFFRMKFLRKLKALTDIPSVLALRGDIHRDSFLNILL